LSTDSYPEPQIEVQRNTIGVILDHMNREARGFEARRIFHKKQALVIGLLNKLNGSDDLTAVEQFLERA